MTTLRTTLRTAVAALSLVAAVATTTAQAQDFPRGGFLATAPTSASSNHASDGTYQSFAAYPRSGVAALAPTPGQAFASDRAPDSTYQAFAAYPQSGITGTAPNRAPDGTYTRFAGVPHPVTPAGTIASTRALAHASPQLGSRG